MFNGLSSRLFEAVREEKGLAYYVGASQVIGYEDAMFSFMRARSPVNRQMFWPKSMRN